MVPSLSVTDLFAWMDRALGSPAEAWALNEYLLKHPGAIDSLPLEARWAAERRWMGIWRRLSGQLPCAPGD
ncbi:hypothetical protein [Deinococcus budaensis]|uniref:Putative nucleotidyltransferase n=1 Tax=Deinococcus budaensis TaxID=1665626 RepID=A0A7W8GGU9_9DEIO|nr:hypothetical protein [Deinococcus budaensis]MBB5235404.1 putative nucleotidyltransferase [Deinococcus budaensis]